MAGRVISDKQLIVNYVDDPVPVLKENEAVHAHMLVITNTDRFDKVWDIPIV